MGRWHAAFLMVLVGSVAAACGRGRPPAGAPGQPTPAVQRTPAVQIVLVVAKEWTFDPSPLVARAGQITFRIRNEGSIEHNFLVEGKPGAQVDAIEPGKSKTLTTQLAAGQYMVFCNLPGHREAGMYGPLKVQ